MMRNPGSVAIGLVLVAGGLLLAGCGSRPPAGDGRIRVVASTTVFADMVANVGGDLVTVRSLVPKNADVHTFEPRPSDIRAVADAQLVVMNGLGLDDWLDKTIASASRPGTPVLRLGERLSGVALLPGDEPGTRNPHVWMDVRYASGYVDLIRDALATADPSHAAGYAARAADYGATLDRLDAWVRAQVGTLPAANRRIVTFHDALPYYAREYGITIVGVAVQAPGQAPSAAYTAELVREIRARGVRAIFSEAAFPTNLVDQLAAETGAKVVATLYDGSLGDPPVTSYEAMIRWDTQELVNALG